VLGGECWAGPCRRQGTYPVSLGIHCPRVWGPVSPGESLSNEGVQGVLLAISAAVLSIRNPVCVSLVFLVPGP
jgi:hypothetical protein